MIGTSNNVNNQVMQSNVRPVNMAPSNISNPQSSYVKPIVTSQYPNNQQPNFTVNQPVGGQGVQVIQGGQPVQSSNITSSLGPRWYISILRIIFISNINCK